MSITLKKGDSITSTQDKVKKLLERMQKKHKQEKIKILKSTAGAVIFDKNKTALEIQKELRDEWQ